MTDPPFIVWPGSRQLQCAKSTYELRLESPRLDVDLFAGKLSKGTKLTVDWFNLSCVTAHSDREAYFVCSDRSHRMERRPNVSGLVCSDHVLDTFA